MGQIINTIYNENCIETLSRLGDQSVDLVITSPPYNMRTRVRNGQYTTREKSEHFSKKYKHFTDDLSVPDFYLFHKNVLSELLRVSKIVCYNFQIVTGSKEAFFKIIGDFAVDIKDIIIWDKGFGQPAMHELVLNSSYELILILEGDKKAGRVIQNAKFERGKMNNILRINKSKNKTDGHNASFPELLVSELIKAFSCENDLIYDPFIGTGTTAIVCKKMNRNYIGSEIVKEYCDTANKKIESELGLFNI